MTETTGTAVLSKLEECMIAATACHKICTQTNLYCEHEGWPARYPVAHTGGWSPGKQVLIPPRAFSGQPQWVTKAFPVNLTRAQVSRSPDIDRDRPVSRRHESELSMHYGWPIYWGG